MAIGDLRMEHLLRRMGFGVTHAEEESFIEIGLPATREYMLDYEQIPDDVDTKIGQPNYVSVTSRGPFSPNTTINDARQRWLFRMVHSRRPLQEKMTLFWHHHFATAYSKINGIYGDAEATRMLAAKPSEDAGGVRGQIEMLRANALGNFRDILIEIAKDPAMLVWLDGRLNVKSRPQENFARELMELFTFGVGYYAEQDVYAGAKVFSGWNLRRVGAASDPTGRYEFYYNPAQHDTSAKTFSFPIYSDGSKTIPARSASDGMQDGLDLINAVARHPETPRRLARRLWGFLVSEVDDPPPVFLAAVSSAYFGSGYSMREVVRTILEWPEFDSTAHIFARYSWPVEFVVRAIKEVGWAGFSVNDALTPLSNMGQQLFEPPDVNGWELGKGWFSTAGTLARMNFAAQLTTNQKFNLRDASRAYNRAPETLLSWALDKVTTPAYDTGAYNELLGYITSGLSNWTGADAQLIVKTPGLMHLIVGSSEYQLM